MNNIKMSKNPSKDIVLCETTNRAVFNHAKNVLLACSVPFSTVWKPIPIIFRFKYNGASKRGIISINRTQYGKARRALTTLERRDLERLLLNVI